MLPSIEFVENALCKDIDDPEVFFNKEMIIEAKSWCSLCQVATICLDYALEEKIEQGVWGGLSEEERRKLQKKIVAMPLTRKGNI